MDPKKLSLKVLSLLVAIMIAFPAWAVVGRVIYTLGIVTVENPVTSPLPQEITGGPFSTLNEGDVIVTGPKAYAQLKLADGTKIAIRPDSRFVIDALEAPATASHPAIGAGVNLRARFSL